MKTSTVILFQLIAVITFSQDFPTAALYGHWFDSTLVASSAHNNVYNEVYSIFNENGEYAVIGSTEGTHIIDVTNPSQPKQIHFVKGKATGKQIIHRDFKKYKNYLFGVCDEGNSSLQIMDYSGLPDSFKVVYDSDAILTTTHNIFIDTAQARLYACYSGSKSGFSALRVIDISDPAHPVQLNKFNIIDGFRLNVGGVHDAYVRNHLAYLNAGEGLAIVDFTDVNDPQLLTGILDYPDAGYNHSGWLSDDGNYYYMADETHGFDLKAFDVSALPDIQVTSTFNEESGSLYSIPHNPYVRGDYLYVAYYFNGLQVYDISNKAQPRRVLHYPTSDILPTNGLYRGAWGVNPDLPSGLILVSDMQKGLFVFEPVETTLTKVKGELEFQELLFPNPSSHHLFLPKSIQHEKSVAITNALGITKIMEVRDGKIDVYSLENGLYILRSNRQQLSFVVQK